MVIHFLHTVCVKPVVIFGKVEPFCCLMIMLVSLVWWYNEIKGELNIVIISTYIVNLLRDVKAYVIYRCLGDAYFRLTRLRP